MALYGFFFIIESINILSLYNKKLTLKLLKIITSLMTITPIFFPWIEWKLLEYYSQFANKFSFPCFNQNHS